MDKYKIVVSEPWDFKSSNGDNTIIGAIDNVLTSDFLIFKSDTFESFEGTTGNLFILKPRYQKQVLSRETNYEGTVGGAILLLQDYDGKTEAFLEKNSQYVFIGSLHRLK